MLHISYKVIYINFFEIKKKKTNLFSLYSM